MQAKQTKQTLLFWRTHAHHQEMLHNGRCTSYEYLFTSVPVTLVFQETTSILKGLKQQQLIYFAHKYVRWLRVGKDASL